MKRAFLALAAAILATAVQAQGTATAQSAPSASWARSDRMIASVPAEIAFPLTAGPLAFTATTEFSHPGEGIDEALQYRSADGAVTGTVYVYYPGLPHASLAAFMTDRTIRANSGTPVRASPAAIARAGKAPAVAIRMDYANYKDGYETSAAFIKAGRWIVKIRVSAPKGRRSDVEAGMKALLDGVEFRGASTPRAARILSAPACRAGGPGKAARLLTDTTGVDTATLAVVGTFDGGGVEGKNERGGRADLPSRVPSELCLSQTVDIEGAQYPILRSPEGASSPLDGRTRLLVMLSDSGDALEIVHLPNFRRYVLMHHLVGETRLLGSFDGVPSDEQMADLLSGSANPAAVIRVPVKLRPGRGPEIRLPAPPPPVSTRST